MRRLPTLRLTILCILSSSSSALAQTADPPVVEQAPEAPAPAQPAMPEPEDALAQLRAMVDADGMTSDQVAERAVDAAPSLAASRAALVVARAGSRRVWQLFFPQVEISARYTRLSDIDQPDFGGALLDAETAAAFRTGIDALSDPAAQGLWNGLVDGLSADAGFSFPVILNQYALRASLSYPVSDLLFTVLPAYRASEAAEEAQEVQLEAEQVQIALRARETYYELARARGAQGIAAKAVEQVEAQRERIAVLVEGGVAAPVDQLRIDAQLAQARVAVAQSRAGAQIAQRALRILMHAEPGLEIGIAENFAELPPPPTETLEALTERALGQRSELRAMERLEEVREHQIRSELGRRYPQLLLQANLDIANPNNRIIPQSQEFNTTWDISVVLRWSPNEMGAARQRVEEVRAQVIQLRSEMDAVRDGIRIEVATGYERFVGARAAWDAAQAGLVAAEAQYRVREVELEAGAAATADLIDADTEVTRARLAALDAAIALRLERARLTSAVGD